MNSTALSTKGARTAISALLVAAAALVLGLALNAGAAKASTPGESISPEFNYVGLNVGTTIAGEINELILEPPADPIGINGEYTDANGNFTVPQAGGLDFPDISVDLGPVVIDGEIDLTKAGSGNYNESTGAMSVDLSLALTLGVDDLEALSQELGFPLGTGALKCRFAPLDVPLSTDTKWPAPGKAYEDKENLEEGALAGAWRHTPNAETVEGDPTVCGLIGGFLQPVGGIWLANTAATLGSMPPPEGPKPLPPTCEEEGLVGTYPDCGPPVTECPAGQTGTPPNCKTPVALINKITMAPKKAKAKAGKKVTLTIKVTNNGDASGKATINLKSSNKQVAVPKKLTVTVGAGKTVTRKIKVNVKKKAKGKANITAKVNGKTAKTTITIQKAKKKKKKK